MDCSTTGLPGPHYLPEFAQVYVHCADDAIQTSHPLPPSSPFAFHLSQHRGLFQWVSSSHQVAIRYWSFTLSSSECSGLTSFRIDWFDLLAVQGTLKSLLEHHSSKASIPLNLNHSFFLAFLFTLLFTSLCSKQLKSGSVKFNTLLTGGFFKKLTPVAGDLLCRQILKHSSQ